MAILIGTDEAGYGPNLGPLVVTATVWNMPDDQVDIDLYKSLGGVISDSMDGDSRVAIADSKNLYKPGGGLGALERGVLPMLGLQQDLPRNWRGLSRILDNNLDSQCRDVPWLTEFDTEIPAELDYDSVMGLADTLNGEFDRTSVRCVAIRSTVVLPGLFNQQLVEHGNKATVLSLTTLSLVKSVFPSNPVGPVRIHCDKHGGRNHYAALLQTVFPESFVEVFRESREESVYRWGPPECRVEARFTARGESCMASALASMTSKYVREMMMKAFNSYWSAQVPGIRPTAGYPVDARRFKEEISDKQKQLGVADRILWRNR